MMNPTKQQCPDKQILMRYLQEEMGEQQELDILGHVESCDRCRENLEAIAMGEMDWDQIQSHLRKESSRFCIPSFAEQDRNEHPSENDREITQLEKILGPSEKPEMMGRIGGYEVIGFVGRGSTGLVVKAYDPRLDRNVAIKILSPNYADSGPARRRFERESRAVAAVAHEHVVPIHSVSEYRNLPFIVMQYISGGSLQTRIDQNGPLTTCEVARIGMQIASGLAAAHAQGIVHRDVKPANVMLGPQVDRAMVSDFGLARVVDEATLTRSGVVAGTPQFMSPEQASGEPVDGRSDLFSLGSTLYAACTGRAPFRADTIFGVIKKVCESEPIDILELNPQIDPVIVSIIAKLQSKNPTERFDSAAEVAEVLSNELSYLQSPSVMSKPKRDWHSAKKQRFPVISKTQTWWALITCAVLGATLIFYLPAIFKGNRAGAPTLVEPTDGDSVFQANRLQINSERPFQSHATKRTQNRIYRRADRLAAKGFRRFSLASKRTYKIASGGVIHLNADLVDISLTTAPVDHVSFRWTRSVMARNPREADMWLRDIELTAEKDSIANMSQHGVIHLNWSNPDRSQFNQRIFADLDVPLFVLLDEQKQSQLEVVIPNNVSIDFSTKRGTITCGSMQTNASFYTGDGHCVLQNVGGSLVVKTINGGVRFATVGEGATISAGGQVIGGDVSGTFVVEAKGFVQAGLCSKNVEIITTEGNVQLERCLGHAEISTKRGDIKIGSLHASVNAHTAIGNIDVIFDGQPEVDSKLGTESGQIKVGVAPRLSLEILATTKPGSLKSEFKPISEMRETNMLKRILIHRGTPTLEIGVPEGSIEIWKLSSGN